MLAKVTQAFARDIVEKEQDRRLSHVSSKKSRCFQDSTSRNMNCPAQKRGVRSGWHFMPSIFWTALPPATFYGAQSCIFSVVKNGICAWAVLPWRSTLEPALVSRGKQSLKTLTASSTGLRRARPVLGTQPPIAPQRRGPTTKGYWQGLISRASARCYHWRVEAVASQQGAAQASPPSDRRASLRRYARVYQTRL